MRKRHDNSVRKAGPQQRWPLTAVLIALALITIVAYWNLRNNDFINFDDQTYITQNRHISGGLSWQGLKWAFTEYYTCNWHPVTWISHMLDVELFGLQPAGHHLVSLGIHVANVLLLAGFLYYVTGRLWPSAFVAAIFALHPLHVESVAWASERKDVLSVFFWMATMWAYAFHVQRPNWLKYLAVLVLLALGLMSKPMLVTLPLVLLLLDYWPFQRIGGDRSTDPKVSLPQLIAEKVPLFLMAGVSSLVTMDAQQGAIAPLNMVSLLTRLTNAAISYSRYMWEMIWPARLAVLYPYPNHSRYPAAIASLVLICGITALAFYLRRRYKYVFTGWLWYLVTLVPVIGLVQVGEQSHADRYTYIPLIGLFIIVAWYAADGASRKPWIRKPVITAAAALTVAAGVLTCRQVSYWRNSLTLLEHTITVTDGNHVAMTNLGNALIARGELDRAMRLFHESIKLAPNKGETLSGIGKILFEKGQLEESWDYYRRAAEARPDLKDAQLNAGSSLIALGRYNEAESYLRKAIELDKDWAEPYAQLGIALGGLGRVDEGIAACREALRLNPELGAAHFSAAALYALKGDFASAVAEYRWCLAVEPTYSVRKNLANCLLAMGNKEEAESMFREAVKQRPDIAESHYNLAIALESLGRRAEAIDELRKAVQLEPDNAEVRQYMERLAQPRHDTEK